MASPVAHSFAGLWSFLLLAQQRKIRLSDQWRRYLGQLCLLVLLANLADFDFIAGLIVGRDLHRGFTHSLLAAILAALAFGWLWRIAESFWASVAISFTAYGSHLLIDFFTGTDLGWTHTGTGLPLFWPLPKIDFSSPLVLVYGVRHGTVSAVLSFSNIRSACFDLLVFGGLTLLLLVGSARYVLKRGAISQRSGRANYLLQPDAADRK